MEKLELDIHNYEQIKAMLESEDREDFMMALQLIRNCDRNDPITEVYIKLLAGMFFSNNPAIRSDKAIDARFRYQNWADKQTNNYEEISNS